MKIVDKIKQELTNLVTEAEIDYCLEKYGYFPIETDEEKTENVCIYTNNKSSIWVKYELTDGYYKVEKVTLGNKKRGATRVRAFRNLDEIKAMMDSFRKKQHYDYFTVMMIEFLAGRRIGDTLRLKVRDFYYPNGTKRAYITTLEEEKTNKFIPVYISGALWDYIEQYMEHMHYSVSENYMDDLFPTDKKTAVYQNKGNITEEIFQTELKKALNSQKSKYRYAFKKAAEANGIQNVSTHTPRKSFGHWAQKLNPNDVDTLEFLQSYYGHFSKETTKIYTDILPEKGENIAERVGKMVQDIDNGIKPVINNAPVISIKTSDLRDLLIMACEGVTKGTDRAVLLNELYGLAENIAI